MAKPASKKKTKKITTSTLLEEFRRQQRNMMNIWGPMLVVVAIGFLIASQFVQPAPPETVSMATGSETGAYYAFSKEYATLIEKDGITVESRETAGTVENLQLLLDDTSGMTVAIAQGGTATPEAREQLRTLASIYLEPVWVFYRGDATVTQIRELKGKRIAIGAEGSGSRQLALRLLNENGIDPRDEIDTSQISSLATKESVAALLDGKADVAIFVISPHGWMIKDLIANPDIKLMSFERDDIYPRRHPYVSEVTLPMGVLDPAANLPDRDIHLIAPAANLVARADIHSALIPLFIEAAKKIHDRGGLVTDPGQFPSLSYAELPVHEEARRYFQNGPSFLHRYLPFWLASFIERSWIMVLPLLTLLIPLFKVAPPVYRWRIRVRIYRWYRVVRAIDKHLGPNAEMEVLRDDMDKLKRLEREVADVWVPLSFMEEFYNLRLHIAYIHRRVERRLAGITDGVDNIAGDSLDTVLPPRES